MTEPATVPADFADLLEVPTATLATIGASGRPQLSAVSFLYEEGVVKISLNETRQKTKNLTRDPKATLFIIDPQNDYRTLELRGDVELSPDPGAVECLRIGKLKYGGADFTEYDGPGDSRVLAVLHPKRVVPTKIG